jgi:hypothetical protein
MSDGVPASNAQVAKMQLMPQVTVARFAQLKTGDLFAYEHSGGPCIGMVVEDSSQDDGKLLLPLGPNLPPEMKWPTLQTPRAFTAISFGKDFALRLPVQPHGWAFTQPPPTTRAILVADGRAYFIANFGYNTDDANAYRACFVEMATGTIPATGSGHFQEYARPSGTPAFAIEWEIVTTEKEPRVILAWPPQSQ